MRIHIAVISMLISFCATAQEYEKKEFGPFELKYNPEEIYGPFEDGSFLFFFDGRISKMGGYETAKTRYSLVDGNGYEVSKENQFPHSNFYTFKEHLLSESKIVEVFVKTNAMLEPKALFSRVVGRKSLEEVQPLTEVTSIDLSDVRDFQVKAYNHNRGVVIKYIDDDGAQLVWFDPNMKILGRTSVKAPKGDVENWSFSMNRVDSSGKALCSMYFKDKKLNVTNTENYLIAQESTRKLEKESEQISIRMHITESGYDLVGFERHADAIKVGGNFLPQVRTAVISRYDVDGALEMSASVPVEIDGNLDSHYDQSAQKKVEKAYAGGKVGVIPPMVIGFEIFEDGDMLLALSHTKYQKDPNPLENVFVVRQSGVELIKLDANLEVDWRKYISEEMSGGINIIKGVRASEGDDVIYMQTSSFKGGKRVNQYVVCDFDGEDLRVQNNRPEITPENIESLPEEKKVLTYDRKKKQYIVTEYYF